MAIYVATAAAQCLNSRQRFRRTRASRSSGRARRTSAASSERSSVSEGSFEIMAWSDRIGSRKPEEIQIKNPEIQRKISMEPWDGHSSFAAR